jgi:hypothetical protein
MDKEVEGWETYTPARLCQASTNGFIAMDLTYLKKQDVKNRNETPVLGVG